MFCQLLIVIQLLYWHVVEGKLRLTIKLLIGTDGLQQAQSINFHC